MPQKQIYEWTTRKTTTTIRCADRGDLDHPHWSSKILKNILAHKEIYYK